MSGEPETAFLTASQRGTIGFTLTLVTRKILHARETK